MLSAKFYRDKKNESGVKRIFNLSRRIMRPFKFKMKVVDGNTEYLFAPANKTELYRYLTFFSKEEGTIEWLKNTLQPDDIFYDIGANVGLYSLYAAKQNKNIKTYAFEPHKINFVTLVQNINLNGFGDVIDPIAIPLGDSCQTFRLNYMSIDSGASMTQLGHKFLPGQKEFKPKLEELVYAVTLDELVEKNIIAAPTVIKIDVDGNELPILKGMSRVLSSANKPRSVQVEANPGQKSMVTEFMKQHGYDLDHSHFTASKKPRLAMGVSEDELAHNVVYVAKAA